MFLNLGFQFSYYYTEFSYYYTETLHEFYTSMCEFYTSIGAAPSSSKLEHPAWPRLSERKVV